MTDHRSNTTHTGQVEKENQGKSQLWCNFVFNKIKSFFFQQQQVLEPNPGEKVKSLGTFGYKVNM